LTFELTRRRVAVGLLASSVALAARRGSAQAATPAAAAAATPGAAPASWLELRSIHTGELCSLALRDTGQQLDAAALRQFAWLLRDHRCDEMRAIDAGVFHQLLDLAVALGVEARYEVISAYRSPRSNEALRAAGRGVARNSLHQLGQAIDVRLQGVSSARLRDAALAAQRGGVGYYQRSDFVHLDTGRVRAWAG
jgi:uncharacterized protein YcbK (DUF882 family)